MDQELIEYVRQHELLYNSKLPQYKDQHLRRKVWEEIGGRLKIKADRAKYLWHKLRRRFSNVLSRRRDKDADYVICPWKYEKQMAFVLPYLEKRKTFKDRTRSDAQRENEEQAESEMEDITERRNTEENKKEPVQGLDFGMERLQKRKNDNNSAQKMNQLIKENSALRKLIHHERRARSKTSRSEDMDETDMFFQSMARMTKQLPKIAQSNIKLTLSNAVLQAEIKSNQKQALNDIPPQRSTPSPALSTSSSVQLILSPVGCSTVNGDEHSNNSFKMSYSSGEDEKPTLL